MTLRLASPLLLASLAALTACDLALDPVECTITVDYEEVEVESPTTADLYAIEGSFIVGAQGTVLKEMSGARWEQLEFPTSADLHGITARFEDYEVAELVVVGAAGTIGASGDQGDTWRLVESPTSADLRAVDFSIDTEHYGDNWVAVGDGVALFSDDGIHWTMGDVPSGAHLNDVHVRGDRSWAVGDGGVLLVSDDEGEHWRSMPTPTTVDLYAITEYQDRRLVVGAGGVVLEIDADDQSVSFVEREGDVDLLGARGAYTVGSHGLIGWIKHSEERTEDLAFEPGSASLRAVDRTSNGVVAVGDQGTIRELEAVNAQGMCG